MILRRKFDKALDIIRKLDERNRPLLTSICEEIRVAEEQLVRESQELLKICYTSCHGICCQNIHPHEIINLTDFIYILTLDRLLETPIRECLRKESLFTSKCIFLEGVEGPCMFPFNLRPEVCLATFCGDVSPIKKEINILGKKFNKLGLFIRFRNVNILKRWLFKDSVQI